MTIKEFKEKYEKLKKDVNERIGYCSFNDSERMILEAYQKILEDLENVELGLEQTKILLVEDGSIEVEENEEDLKRLGYKVIVYRKGANRPEIL